MKFSPGIDIKFDEKLFKMNLSEYSSEKLKLTDTSFPLVIRLVILIYIIWILTYHLLKEKIDTKQQETKIFYYYFFFTHEDNQYRIKFFREKMEVS